MLTPQDIQNKEFGKAVFGGYDMAAVDDFLEELTDDYASLYKENAILKSKMKVLVEKVEEYRATEDAMRMALVTAQKTGDSITRDATEKSTAMVSEAEEKSRLGMNIRRDDSVWRAELPSSEARPDELRPLERRHVVRAYADFMDSDDASLTIGPELMLKDEHNEWGKKSRPEENDPSVGLGMQFSLDF